MSVSATLSEAGPSDGAASDPFPSLRVIKRNGQLAAFDAGKIRDAMQRAFLAVEGGAGAESSRIQAQVRQLTANIVDAFLRRLPANSTVHIESIQDQVELALMRAGAHRVARAYVLYREDHARRRAERDPREAHPSLTVTLANGKRHPLDLGRLRTLIAEACEGLHDVDGPGLLEETLRNLYDGMPESDVSTALVITARARIEKAPDYGQVTARLLLDSLRGEALRCLGLGFQATACEMAMLYPQALAAAVRFGCEKDLLDPRLEAFDLERLGRALRPERDGQFAFLGLQTLYDRYFLHHEGLRFELPQVFFMRVAMGLALNEPEREDRAIAFYELLSSFDYMASTPTLFNSGTTHSQLSSCYLTTVPDDLGGIYGALRDNALLSKWAGGLGNDWTPVRSLGAAIKGTNGKSQGVVPFLKVVNDTAVAVNQGGKRKGAVCAYLETWHLDIEEFLELRKNTGDDRRRTHDMNTAHWIPDLFMERVFDDGNWTLFSPSDVSDLHDLYGTAFRTRYEHYEAQADSGAIKLYKRVKAGDLWRRMLSMLFETGHPWLTFKDPCNLRSPQQHVGVVHSSNLCTEITLNTSVDEIAVCNLGSVNLANHLHNGALDTEHLARTVSLAVRMLDNVIDINFYAVPQARNANLRHRPVGLGLMGFQDALQALGMAYASPQAVDFADSVMEQISYHAIRASALLARERGAYESYAGSLWDQGVLPIDSIRLLQEARPEGYLELDTSAKLDWLPVRELVREHGMRNSNVMAIAPTATIANIVGVSASIEPTFRNLYVKSNLSGEFTVINPLLVDALKARGLWDEVMVNDLKYHNGSVQPIARIPDDLKALFATAFEIEPRWLVEAAARRQKWLDQAQSLNLYIAEPDGRKLDVTYRMAWLRGLKTTYYLRSQGATTAEKSTLHDGALNAVKATPEPELKLCALDDPGCEACQ
ncbi:ribonucleoside-diphosphate reductase subunit alpha [Mangrovitalea sediminis]|uniref:ribonucleoside-diphosphate reductase subunit alpha n=1 Tax=Mangrovitalea sediminis TaxID=1982043 RepID=UPI000BE586D1|nr:ribonucleoside-diphosphate reductase subunit alpha [Mangrovitalea sediminis]